MSVGVGVESAAAELWGWLPLAAGVAVVDALAAVTGLVAGLKWPNDVLVGDRKVAGILAEVAAPRPTVVIGIGLNVARPPADLGSLATSVLGEGGSLPDRAALIQDLLRQIGFRITRWRDRHGDDPLLAADYRMRSTTIGSRVRAELPGGRTITGNALAVDTMGRLEVDDGGDLVTLSAGDIVHLRLAE
jgi:BirA family biotin operon repressor/biotin-[acetyl-CoA-carboxylase] ligase